MHQPRSRLLYKGKGIFIQPEIIALVGGRSSAQFLQQIHYFITSSSVKGTSHQGHKWVYQTLDQWAEILAYSPSTIKNCIRTLQNLNLIKVEKLCKYKSNRTNFYTINYEVLSKVLDDKTNIPDLDKETLSINLENNLPLKPKIVSPQVKNCPMVTTKSSNSDTNNISNKSKNSLNKPFSELMLNAWNDIIKPEGIVALTKKRCQYLMAVMKHFFNWDLKKWQNYCHLITSSDFLMGKVKPEFKASLDWVLKFETIQKILEGQYGIKKPASQQADSTALTQEILGRIGQEGESPVVISAKKLFLNTYGAYCFKDWLIAAGVTMDYQQSSLVIKCSSNKFIRDEVFKKFDNLLTKLHTIGINRVIMA